MVAIYYVTPTDYGLSLIAQAHQTESILLSELVLGDAGGSPYDPISKVDRTSLVNQRAAVPVQSVQRVNNNTVEVRALVGNHIGGFNLHEIGLTDATGQLVYIGNHHGGYKPELAEGAAGEIQYTIEIAPAQGSSALIQAVNPVTASQNWVLEKLEQHRKASDPHPQYATDVAVDESVNYLLGLLLQHATAENPHPQYLMADVFGVNLEMTAQVGRTEIKDTNRVLGWNGQDGDWSANTGEIYWGRRVDGAVEFKPYRAYGNFLLHGYVTTATLVDIRVVVFNEDGTEFSNQPAAYFYDGRNYSNVDVNHVFRIPKRGKAVIYYSIAAGGSKRALLAFSVYVDDRVKVFTPVGLTSVVDSADFSGSSNESTDSGYDIYPAFEWFYKNATGQYIELSSSTSMTAPANRAPHYHRCKFTDHTETDLYIAVQVGTQTVETPSEETPSDYTVLETQVIRARTDDTGLVVVEVPLSLRSATAPNDETLVYKVGYSMTEPVVGAEPVATIGEYQFYVRR
jgi:hypothetical protein